MRSDRLPAAVISILIVGIFAACTTAAVEETTTSATSVTLATTTTASSATPSNTTPPTTGEYDPAEIIDFAFSLTTVPPIEGYGDFSDVDLIDLDYFLIAQLQIQCAHDNGIPLKLMPDGNGIAFDDVPLEQNRRASIVLAGCTNGLKLPQATGPYGGYTREQARRLYDHYLWMVDCYGEYDLYPPDPPSFETWLDSGLSWNPTIVIVDLSIARAGEIDHLCPRFPAGRQNLP